MLPDDGWTKEFRFSNVEAEVRDIMLVD